MKMKKIIPITSLSIIILPWRMKTIINPGWAIMIYSRSWRNSAISGDRYSVKEDLLIVREKFFNPEISITNSKLIIILIIVRQMVNLIAKEENNPVQKINSHSIHNKVGSFQIFSENHGQNPIIYLLLPHPTISSRTPGLR